MNPAYGVVLHPDIESREYAENYFKLESDKLLISAFTFDKTLNKNIIRIFNPTNETACGRLLGINIPQTLTKIVFKYGTASESSETVPANSITLKAGEITTFCD